MTGAGIISEPHAPMHDMLGAAGLLKPVEEEFIVRKPKIHHPKPKIGEVEVDFLATPPTPEYAHHY